MPNFDKTTGFKMGGSEFYGHGSQSPAKKTLVGNQHNLPEGLKNKIEAAPGKMYGTPNKMIAGLVGTAATVGAMSKIGKSMKEDKDAK